VNAATCACSPPRRHRWRDYKRSMTAMNAKTQTAPSWRVSEELLMNSIEMRRHEDRNRRQMTARAAWQGYFRRYQAYTITKIRGACSSPKDAENSAREETSADGPPFHFRRLAGRFSTSATWTRSTLASRHCLTALHAYSMTRSRFFPRAPVMAIKLSAKRAASRTFSCLGRPGPRRATYSAKPSKSASANGRRA
jgi:hypothetical protein